MKRSLLLSIAVALVAPPVLFAQTGDAPAVDVAQLLQALKQIREQNDVGIKNRRMQAYQQVTAAMASPEKAMVFWKEAVKNAQFEGADKEAAQLRDWREGDGEALSDKFCQGAVVLHLRWLAISLQHAAGIETKQLLPQVIEYTKAIQADEAAADHFADQLDKAKERTESGKHGMVKKGVNEDVAVKRVHDTLMRTAVGSSPVARWLQLGDLLEGGGKRAKQGAGPGDWESVPGNWEGIYSNIILPEFRALKDPRLMDYWDLRLKRETERAADKKLDVEQRDWTQIRRPGILWGRAQDVLLLGYKNRAIVDMFTLVKTFPQHPDALNWIGQIEATLVPGGVPSSTTPSATVTPPTASGLVPPPVAVPPATTPPATGAPVPTATIVPTPPAATTPGVRR
jgi:hypothetical protein